MCLIVLHWIPGQQLTLSANRDEFTHRPAAPLTVWHDAPDIIAGRDLEQGGTWLGLTRQHRFAALTNVRAPGAGPTNPPSRGHLVSDFLRSSTSTAAYAQTLHRYAHRYAPFNLLCGGLQQLWYITNHPQPACTALTPGLHVLSNARLNTPWPKARLARQQLQAWLQQPGDSASLARLLNRQQPFADHELPQTGVPADWERLLSAQFIHAPGYGTRCSTGLILTPAGADIHEISWDNAGQVQHQAQWPSR